LADRDRPDKTLTPSGFAAPAASRAVAFTEALRQLTRLADCAALFREEIATFGFDTFACGSFDGRDRDLHVFYIIDWPESWTKFYVESGLINRDPLLDELKTTDQPFTWSELRAGRRLSKGGTEAINRAAAEGWVEGLVVPIPGVNNRLGLVSMVGHRDVDVSERDYLTLISMALHHHARSLAPREGFAMPPMGLTEREIAAIRHVGHGLSDAEIGEAMGVAKTTAHEFVEKARAKLKARNRAALTAISVSLGIIDL
jgi:DNA-binding CsgD family transcriptional regulator